MATAKTKKPAKSPVERMSQQRDEMIDKIAKRAEESAEQTRKRARHLALSVIELEKTTFDNTFKLVDKLQKHTEDLVKEYVAKAEWMPREGRAMVEEWARMLQTTRREFLKTVDKSFDHVAEYIKRLEEGKEVPEPKKRVAAKKAAAPAARKKAAKKPAAAAS